MTPTERERIEKEAYELYDEKYAPFYIAGALAEHDKARNQAIDECIMTISCSHQFLLSDKVKELEQLKTIS